jgi:asparagine synthase (glutamine-hydrolysing)
MALAGSYSPGGGAPDAARVAALGAALRQLGPDTVRRLEQPGLALVHRGLDTGAERSRCRGVSVAADGSVVCIDGRLDNLDEVRGLFPVGGLSPEAAILAMVRQRGIEGLAPLVGDFTGVVWEARLRQLVLFNDAMGRRPLYYAWRQGRLYWCSLARPLRDHVLGGGPVSLDYAADFLSNRLPSTGPFEGVECITGGCAYIADTRSAHQRRYWQFDQHREIRYASDAEYEDAFRAVFVEAVACRTRTNTPVFCELSGGVDSSSIACVAMRAPVSGRNVHAVSYTFPGSFTAQEEEYVQAVERDTGRAAFRISDQASLSLTRLPQRFTCDVPTNGLWVLRRFDAVARLMSRHGARVLLSGIGGDQMFWSEYHPGLPIADLVARGRLVRALRESARIAQEVHRPALGILVHGAAPALPRWWQSTLATYAGIGEWFAPRFVRERRLRERMLPMPDEAGFPLPSSRMQSGLIRRSMRVFALDPCLTDAWFDMRYPYLDRRVAEFALAIPLSQKARGRQSRSIVRRGLAGIVPEAVLQRRSKAGPGEAFLRALGRAWHWLAPLFERPRLADLGIVNPDLLGQTLSRARHGAVRHQAQLTWTISLELWLRHLDGDPAIVEPSPAQSPNARYALSLGS